ncbi:MAG: cyclodeaminase/cyclohydrolase family protein [Elusimicrobiaceae bacterium]|nr:cyclodeaminase/cyclohydrolase family protein [Elusimicrobiaceae bacterium]
MEWFKAAEKFNIALASAEPTPGGGAAAAMAATMGCALALMAALTTVNKKATSEEVKSRLDVHIRKLGALKNQLNGFIQEDSIAYSAFIVAKKLPKDAPDRAKAMEDALIYAARVPTDTATTAIQCLREIDVIKDDISPVIMSDILCAQHLLKSAIRCCIENIQANLAFIHNQDWTQKFNQHIQVFLKSC